MPRRASCKVYHDGVPKYGLGRHRDVVDSGSKKEMQRLCQRMKADGINVHIELVDEAFGKEVFAVVDVGRLPNRSNKGYTPIGREQ